MQRWGSCLQKFCKFLREKKYMWAITADYGNCCGGINSKCKGNLGGNSKRSWLHREGAGAIQRAESIFHQAQHDKIDGKSWDPDFFPLALNTLAIPAFSKLFTRFFLTLHFWIKSNFHSRTFSVKYFVVFTPRITIIPKQNTVNCLVVPRLNLVAGPIPLTNVDINCLKEASDF